MRSIFICSGMVAMGWAGNPYKGVDVWLEAEHEWQDFRPSLSERQFIEVQYKSLTSDPKLELNKICEFLEQDFDEQMFNYTNNTSYKFPDPKYNYQWKRKQGQSSIQQVESKARDVLLSRGYELSQYPEIKLRESLINSEEI